MSNEIREQSVSPRTTLRSADHGEHSPHIVYASFDRFPSPKGAATHIDAFVRALGRRFGRVSLLTVPPVEDEPGVADWRAEGVEHAPLPSDGAHLFARVRHFRTQMWQWWQRQFADDQRPDIVHIRSINEGYPIARFKDRFCRRLVYEVNGLPSIELKYHYPRVAEDRELLAKLRNQEQCCLEAADLILTVSQVNARHLVSRGVDERLIRVIPNGVDLDLFTQRNETPPGWPEDRPLRLLYCGGLTAWQGVNAAVEALALYVRDFPAELKIIGPSRPRQRKQLERQAFDLGVYDRVSLNPPVDRSALAAAHHQADVVLAPLTRNDRNTKQGCCPLKILEAMACGSPLVASDLEVVRELAENDREALLVRPNSGKAIKDALLRLRADRFLAERLSAAARRRVEREFTWGRAEQRLLGAYEELMNGP